jgi:hypothetical protein
LMETEEHLLMETEEHLRLFQNAEIMMLDSTFKKMCPTSLSDIHIDDSDEGSSQFKVPSISI